LETYTKKWKFGATPATQGKFKKLAPETEAEGHNAARFDPGGSIPIR
jgi:hypothetical protein